MDLLLSPNTLVAQRFSVEKLAARGGMSSIYRACDMQSGHPVALKVLHGTSHNDQEVERFAREARLLASLEHPGIVRFIAYGQTPEGSPFLAMEWLDGEDLAHALQRRGLSLSESLLLCRKVTEALAVAHRCGIIHRVLNLKKQRREIHKLSCQGKHRESQGNQVLSDDIRRQSRPCPVHPGSGCAAC